MTNAPSKVHNLIAESRQRQTQTCVICGSSARRRYCSRECRNIAKCRDTRARRPL